MKHAEAFILALFDRHQGLKSAQLYHILKAKRTGSTLYQALIHDVLNYYGLFPSLDRQSFDSWINGLIEEGILIKTDDAGRLVLNDQKKGEILLFQSFIPPHCQLQQVSFGFFDQPFWLKCQFITQVLSQKAHGQMNFQPLSSSPIQQYRLKKWLVKHPYDQSIQGMNREWDLLLHQLKPDHADIIARQLTGYNRVGKTLIQLVPDHLSPYIIQKNILHPMMKEIAGQAQTYPFFYSLLNHARKENYLGLSPTAFQTYRLLSQGISVEEIARLRKVKVGTIADHLIEIAIFCGFNTLHRLYDDRDRQLVHRFLDQHVPVFKEFSNQHPDFPFYKYRLIEIERIKTGAKQD